MTNLEKIQEIKIKLQVFSELVEILSWCPRTELYSNLQNYLNNLNKEMKDLTK